jgi:REP element-mobilizing transposase RayT
MSRSRYQFADPAHPHFLTCTVVEWLPVFTRQEAVQIVLDSWTHLQRREGLRLYGYVVLENHLHAIAQSDALPTLWGRFKSYSARQIIDRLEAHHADALLKRLGFALKARRTDRQHQFWQEGSHPQVIVGEAMLRQKLEYIHQNPVKRGYVDLAEHWRWSSARDYAGGEGLIEVYKDW